MQPDSPNQAGGQWPNQPANQGPPQPPGQPSGIPPLPPTQQASGIYSSAPEHPYVPVPPPQKQKQKKINWDFWKISLILTVMLLLSVSGFAVWAYLERNTYKNKTDEIVAHEVELARQETATEKDKEFVEREKQPFKEYRGPAQFGGIHMSYPKTWSAYIDESDRSSNPVDGYLHPSFVPGTRSGTSFALRIQVLERPYDTELKSLDSKVRSGDIQASPYRAKNVPDVIGVRIVGEINRGQKNTMVMFPLRDKTIKIWTESEQFVGDLDNIILANLIFAP